MPSHSDASVGANRGDSETDGGYLSELVIFPEMLAAGAEQIRECRLMDLDDAEVAERVFAAMYGVFLITCVRGESERVH